MIQKTVLRLAFVFVAILPQLWATPATAASSKSDSYRLNLRIFPIGMLLNEYMGELNYAPLSFFSIGAIGYFANVNMDSATAKGKGWGGRATVHFKGTYFDDSWIFSIYFINIGKMDFSTTFSNNFGTATGSVNNALEYGATLGKMWFYGPFNITLALGMRGITAEPNSIVLISPVNPLVLTEVPIKGGLRLDFALGWAF